MNKLNSLYTTGLIRFKEKPEDGGGEEKVEQKTFTQEDVNRLTAEAAAKAKRTAETAAKEALKEKLGDAKLEELIALAEAQKTADDAKKTEAEKLLEQAQAAQKAADEALADAKTKAHDARVRAALRDAGAPQTALNAITVPDITVESTDEDVTAAVTALKTAIPGLFTGTTTGTDADPGKPGDKAKGEIGEAGKSEFERRKAERELVSGVK